MSSKSKSSNKLGEAIKSFDLFGEGVTFEIEGRSTKTSYLGSLISLVIIVITTSYAFTRFGIMREYNDTSYQETTSDAEYSPESPLTYEKSQFDFAIGIQDNNAGELQFPADIDTHFYFSVINFVNGLEDGSPSLELNSLKLRQCTQEDVESRFSTSHPGIKSALLASYCLEDPGSFGLYGEVLNDPVNSMVKISLQYCSSSDPEFCSTKDEANEWLDKKIIHFFHDQ